MTTYQPMSTYLPLPIYINIPNWQPMSTYLPSYINTPTHLCLLTNTYQPMSTYHHLTTYLPLPIPKFQYRITADPGAGIGLVRITKWPLCLLCKIKLSSWNKKRPKITKVFKIWLPWGQNKLVNFLICFVRPIKCICSTYNETAGGLTKIHFVRLIRYVQSTYNKTASGLTETLL